MREAKLSGMKRGWFVGDFTPAAFSTEAAEVAVKSYRRGEAEAAHRHKIATEITLVTRGKIRMFGREFREGDIIVAEPGDATSFLALTDAALTVVKVPSVRGDKYPAEEETIC